MHGHRDHIGFPRHLLTFLLALLFASPPLVAQFGAVGLSGVRGQRFGNEDLLVYFPEQGDFLASALAVGDFNGDGADDLAAGAPGDNNLGGFTPNSGIVVVRYGIPGQGLDVGLAADVLTQAASGSFDPAEDGDAFGTTLAACDVNDDGFDDLIVGVPLENLPLAPDAGAIQIHFGFTAGLPFDGDLFVTQGTAGVPGDPYSDHKFGGALACADFDGDGFDDIALGVPREFVEEVFHVGRVTVIRGGPFPLNFSTTYFIDQGTPGMLEEPESGDEFGAALTTGDFDGDGFADLVAGIPGEDHLGQLDVGALHVVRGSSFGLVPGGNQFLTASELGGIPAAGDFVGASLKAGDFDGDGHDDLLVGMPAKDFDGGTIVDGGQVFAIYGYDDGLDSNRTQLWVENFVHGPGATETGDRFGATLAVGDFDADGFDDAVIGHPGEFGLVFDDGEVSIVMGSPSGLTSARVHGLSAGQWGHPGVPNQGDRNYGEAVATGDFDGDGYSDLAIGAPNENEALADVGAAVVLYGSLFADGFDSQSFSFWSGTLP